jgi:uncharacterized protein (TIGR02246 family)
MKTLLLAVPLLFMAPLAQAADMKAVETKTEVKIAEMKGPDLKTKIEAANQLWVAAFNKGDSSALAALYTDQATVLPPGGDMVIGHDNLLKFWKDTIQSGLKVTSLTTVSVERHGMIAKEIGRLAAEAPNADKKMVPMEGKYVVVWREVKGTWKLDADIWNLNK